MSAGWWQGGEPDWSRWPSSARWGYLIDNASVVDFEAGVEFLLTAVLQVNRNRIYNDDRYEYDEVGLPFLARLGRAVYRYELARERPRSPDLSRFRVREGVS